MILVTGGAGYIGSHCVKLLNKMGQKVVVLDNLIQGHREAVSDVELIEGDIGDVEILREILATHPIKAVMHFAALSNVGESVKAPELYFSENVEKMNTLLKVLGESGVKYFIFSSSAAIFGEPEYLPIDEQHIKRPINPYGETKLLGEKLLQEAEDSYGMRYCALRYFNAAGASIDGTIGESHNPEHHLIPLICQKALNKTDDFKVYGNDYSTSDGTCVRDYIHVEDLSMAHYLALKYLIEKNESNVFNLGSQNGFSVKEIITEFEKVSGINFRYTIESRRVGDPAELIASSQYAKKELGWNSEYSNIQMILKTALNWEKNRRY